MSELYRRATELIGVLYGILQCLEQYSDDIGPRYAKQLRPMVADLVSAISIRCSISEAKDVLSRISEVMHIVNGAATKGEHDFFPRKSDLLNHFWALETIFRETRYSKMSLAYDWQSDAP